MFFSLFRGLLFLYILFLWLALHRSIFFWKGKEHLLLSLKYFPENIAFCCLDSNVTSWSWSSPGFMILFLCAWRTQCYEHRSKWPAGPSVFPPLCDSLAQPSPALGSQHLCPDTACQARVRTDPKCPCLFWSFIHLSSSAGLGEFTLPVQMVSKTLETASNVRSQHWVPPPMWDGCHRQNYPSSVLLSPGVLCV